MSALDYILIVIILILIIILLSLYKRMDYICKVLNEVLQGNFNQRIRLQNNIKPLKELTISTNNVIEKLQKANEDNKINQDIRRKMISNISHDLRTPLTSMLGYLELILENDEKKSRILDNRILTEKKKEEYLKIIYNKGIYLYNLMEEFFQISKLDANDIKLDIKEVNISEIIRENIVLFFCEIEKRNIHPIINIPEADIYLFTDEKALSRILTNLINNSLKHGTNATIIGVNLNYDETNIYIEIYDNGAGIPEDEIDYIFDRLYTVEKSRKLDVKGSGLGLTIVKKIVQSLGGKISVQSIPFEKTIFMVTLPRR